VASAPGSASRHVTRISGAVRDLALRDVGRTGETAPRSDAESLIHHVGSPRRSPRCRPHRAVPPAARTSVVAVADPVERVRPPGNAVLAALVAGVGLALALTWVAGPTAGGVVLGADLATAAVLRLVLPVRVAGALAVRSRPVDVLVLLVLAVACTSLAWLLPVEP
jgi:hypothetical protein